MTGFRATTFGHFLFGFKTFRPDFALAAEFPRLLSATKDQNVWFSKGEQQSNSAAQGLGTREAVPNSGTSVDRVTLEPTLRLLGITMRNQTMVSAVDELIEGMATDRRQRVCFANPHCLNVAWKDLAYRSVLSSSEVVFPDGIGIRMGCRMTGQTMRANLNGTDMFPVLCSRLEHSPHGIFLLGAKPGIGELLVAKLTQDYPGLRIMGHHHGYFDQSQESDLIAAINGSGAKLLFVAMGVPGQELWIDKHWPRLGVSMAFAVGGLFDFYSGRIPRAPHWMRRFGMEWVFRLIQEPRRMWRRYLIGNLVFLRRVLRHGRSGP